MSDRGHQLLYRAAHAAARRAGAVPDADLVRRLANHNDRAAFELLLWRHGPAVWGVCRRVLGPTPDAEDAFQAVFLALNRRAPTITDGNAVARSPYRGPGPAALAAGQTPSPPAPRAAPAAGAVVGGGRPTPAHPGGGAGGAAAARRPGEGAGHCRPGRRFRGPVAPGAQEAPAGRQAPPAGGRQEGGRRGWPDQGRPT